MPAKKLTKLPRGDGSETRPYKVRKAGGGFWRLLEWRQLRKSRRWGYVCVAIGNREALKAIAERLNVLL